MNTSRRGFTLIELMVVVVMIAIMAAIAIPTYKAQIRRADQAAVQQEMLMLAEQLERYKSRSLSYRGFDPKYVYSQTTAMSSLNFPVGSSDDNKKYTITLADVSESTATTLLSTSSGLGQQWAIKAIPTKVNYLGFLATSSGSRCSKKYNTSNDLTNINAYSCTGSDTWQ